MELTLKLTNLDNLLELDEKVTDSILSKAKNKDGGKFDLLGCYIKELKENEDGCYTCVLGCDSLVNPLPEIKR